MSRVAVRRGPILALGARSVSIQGLLVGVEVRLSGEVGSIVERLGEGRLRGLSGPYPSMTDASVPLAEAPFPFNSYNLPR